MILKIDDWLMNDRIRAILYRWRHRWRLSAIRRRQRGCCLRVCRRDRGIPAARSRPKPWWSANSSRPVHLTLSTRWTDQLNGSGGCLPSGASAPTRTTAAILRRRWSASARPCRGRIPLPARSTVAVKWPVPLRPTLPTPTIETVPPRGLTRGPTRRGFSMVHPHTLVPLRTVPKDTLPPVWAVAVSSPRTLITSPVYPEEPTGSFNIKLPEISIFSKFHFFQIKSIIIW